MRCGTLHPNQNALSKTNIYALVTVNIVVGVSNILLNSTIAYSLWRTRMIKTLSFKFIFLLSISDCMVGLVVSPVIVTLFILQKQPFCILEHFAQSLTFMMCQFSGVMVVIITLDRYLHMKYLTRYSIYMTTRRAYVMIAINFKSCICTVLLLTLGSMHNFIFQFEVSLVSIYSALVGIIFLLYLKTFITLRQRVHEISTIHNNRINETRQKSELIFAKGMNFVLLCTSMCYLPCFLSGTIWAYRKYVIEEEPPVWLHATVFWTCILMFANSTFNPIAMLTFNKRLRDYVCRFITSLFKRPNRSDISDSSGAFHTRKETMYETRS